MSYMYNSSCSDNMVHKDSAWGNNFSRRPFSFLAPSPTVKDNQGGLKEEATLGGPWRMHTSCRQGEGSWLRKGSRSLGLHVLPLGSAGSEGMERDFETVLWETNPHFWQEARWLNINSSSSLSWLIYQKASQELEALLWEAELLLCARSCDPTVYQGGESVPRARTQMTWFLPHLQEILMFW